VADPSRARAGSIGSATSALDRQREVWVHVYDMGPVTGRLNQFVLRGANLGAFHVGVEVLGEEWSFQGFHDAWDDDTLCGVLRNPPRNHPDYLYRESVCLGMTPLDEDGDTQLDAQQHKRTQQHVSSTEARDGQCREQRACGQDGCDQGPAGRRIVKWCAGPAYLLALGSGVPIFEPPMVPSRSDPTLLSSYGDEVAELARLHRGRTPAAFAALVRPLPRPAAPTGADLATGAMALDAAPPGAALQLGEWEFCGGTTVIYPAAGTLSNSIVIVGRAARMGPGAGAKAAIMVAAKVVALDSGSREELDAIRREHEVLREISNAHPHVLPMLDFVEAPTGLVLLTRFAPRGDLSACLPRNTCAEEAELRKLSRQLLSALAFLHGRSIIHGDVKPSNVLLTELGGAMAAQLADFGLSRRVPLGQTFVHLCQVQGSHGFIPAEVMHRQELHFASDLFALGVLVFRYLGGYDPFYPASKVCRQDERASRGGSL
ncbi:unnamed protein product, partial [Prorocentrum cordatum]